CRQQCLALGSGVLAAGLEVSPRDPHALDRARPIVAADHHADEGEEQQPRDYEHPLQDCHTPSLRLFLVRPPAWRPHPTSSRKSERPPTFLLMGIWELILDTLRYFTSRSGQTSHAGLQIFEAR